MPEPIRPTLVVERRSISRMPLLLRLPYPLAPIGSRPPVGESASERYRSWCERATRALPRARARVSGPVEIVMTVKEHPGGERFERISRTVLGFLAARGVIDDDRARTVRKMVLSWGPADGVVVEVLPVETIQRPSL